MFGWSKGREYCDTGDFGLEGSVSALRASEASVTSAPKSASNSVTVAPSQWIEVLSSF
jgi:hypothetical protein